MDPHDPHAPPPTRDRSNGSGRAFSSADDELDALAELFLGAAPGRAAQASLPPTREDRQTGRVPLEGLILGHLPVFAAAWPAQYARHRAAAAGRPVLVVRYATDRMIVEVVGAKDPTVEASPDAELAIASAAARCAACIVRVEEDREGELAGLADLDSLVLLTGADDAAVVACYRKLKAIASGASSRGAPQPRVGLAVMGAPLDRAEATHERIARAAREFLEAALLEPVILERIASSHTRTIYHGPGDIPLDRIGELVRRESGRAADGRERSPVAPAGAPPAGAPRNGVEPLGGVSRAGSARVAVRERGEGVEAAPLPALAGGLTPIESGCPVARAVALASDGAGGLHLIAASLRDHPSVSSGDPVRELLRARAWARLNSALLRKAEPCLGEGAGSPVLHVVTDDPRDARALAGTPVRVHLAVAARAAALGLVTVRV